MTSQEIVILVMDKLATEVYDIRQIVGRNDVNDVYIATTEQGKYVVRIDPHEGTTVRFDKETWCIEESRKIGVPGPEVLTVGLVQGHPYMVTSYIEGVSGDEKPDSKEIWKALGKYARKIHVIKVEGFSENMITPGVFNDSWSRFVDYNIESLTPNDKALQRGFITEKQSARLKEIFGNLKTIKFNFGLSHRDLSLNNTILGRDGTVYLLDWGSAEVTVVPHLDIAEILDSSLTPESPEFRLFLDNYGLPYEKFQELKPEIDQLNLLVYMDKVRWAIDRRPDRLEERLVDLKKRMAQLDL